MPSTRLIEFGEGGEIILPKPKLRRVNVRFPNAKEQAVGIIEVPRSVREKERSIAVQG